MRNSKNTDIEKMDIVDLLEHLQELHLALEIADNQGDAEKAVKLRQEIDRVHARIDAIDPANNYRARLQPTAKHLCEHAEVLRSRMTKALARSDYTTASDFRDDMFRYIAKAEQLEPGAHSRYVLTPSLIVKGLDGKGRSHLTNAQPSQAIHVLEKQLLNLKTLDEQLSRLATSIQERDDE